MVDLSLLQSVSYIAGALGVCVAAVFYVLNLRISQRNMREAEENKKIQLSINIAEKFGSKEFRRDYVTLWQLDWKDVNDFMKKYDDSVKNEGVKELFAQRYSVWLAYDNVGYLLRKGLVDDEVVFNSAGSDSVVIWGRYWSMIDYYRRTELGQKFLENFEFLARSMWSMGKAMGRTSPGFKDGLTFDRFKDVYEPEAAVSTSP
jgi:hypothetical protein